MAADVVKALKDGLTRLVAQVDDAMSAAVGEVVPTALLPPPLTAAAAAATLIGVVCPEGGAGGEVMVMLREFISLAGPSTEPEVATDGGGGGGGGGGGSSVLAVLATALRDGAGGRGRAFIASAMNAAVDRGAGTTRPPAPPLLLEAPPPTLATAPFTLPPLAPRPRPVLGGAWKEEGNGVAAGFPRL